MDNAIGTDDDLHCIRYSLLMPVPRLPVPTDWYLQVEEPPTSPCRGVVHRSKRKGYAMHESFLVCSSTPMSCVSFVKYSAHLTRAVKEHPLRQHRRLPMQAQAGCTEYNAVRRPCRCIVHFRRKHF